MGNAAKESVMATTALPHDEAIEAFVDRVVAAELAGLERLILFGSVARESHSATSDIDILAVIREADEAAIEEQLREIAYEVMLEYGVVFSIQGITESTLENRSDHPFFKRALSEGEILYG